MSFPKYERYKDSGIKWLGKIPEHWTVKRLKRVGEAIIGLIYEPKDIVDEGQGTLVLRSSNVQEGQIVFEDNVFVKKDIPERLKTRIGDILICSRNGSRALIGKNAQIDENSSMVTFGAFMTIFRSVYNNYLFYVFNSELFDYQSGAFLTSTINQLTISNLYSFEVPIPPLDDQRFIVAFLDCETSKIDALIDEQHNLIELLQEKRQATISHAVTKGLNPSAPMKDSGVEWLGEVPERWEVKQLKWAVTLQRGHDLTTEERIDGIAQLVTSSGIVGTHNAVAAKGPGIVTGRYGTIGEFYFVKEDYWPINTTLYSVNLHGNYALFLYYLLIHLSPFFLLHSVKSAVPGVDRNDVHPTLTTVPPLNEQHLIATFLNHETGKIDALIAEAETAITLLQERRSALISAAVTGKIDVRGLVNTELDAVLEAAS